MADVNDVVDVAAFVSELRLIAEYACWDKFEERFTSVPKKHPAWRAADLLAQQAAREEALTKERDEARADYEQAADWNGVVDQHGLDGFDALASQWLEIDAIQRMHNAAASVFSKWANDELMARFKQHMTNIMHTAFVEGAIVGVRASRPSLTAAEAEIARLREALDWIARFAAIRSKDDRMTAVKVHPGALRNIAERARAALSPAAEK